MTYTFPLWIPVTAWAIAGTAILLALVFRKTLVVLMVGLSVGALVGLLIAPAITIDRVVLDDEKLEQTTGFWWSPTVKGFHYDEVASVRIIKARGRKNREYEAWVVKLRSGGTREIDPGDLWDMNRADIVQRLRDKGVEVQLDVR